MQQQCLGQSPGEETLSPLCPPALRPKTALVSIDRTSCCRGGWSLERGLFCDAVLSRAEVLSADAFSAFEEVGLDDADAVAKKGRAFRDTVLSLGGGRAPALVFKARPFGADLRRFLLVRGQAAGAGSGPCGVTVKRQSICMRSVLRVSRPAWCCRTSGGGSPPQSRCCATTTCCRPLHELELAVCSLSSDNCGLLYGGWCLLADKERFCFREQRARQVFIDITDDDGRTM